MKMMQQYRRSYKQLYSIFSVVTKNGEGSFAMAGGGYEQPHDEMLRETKSVPKTNAVREVYMNYHCA